MLLRTASGAVAPGWPGRSGPAADAGPRVALEVVSNGFHPPLEEYLEAIHALEEEGIQVIQARLAERLGHSAPSVSEMIRRLRSEGYVAVKGRSVQLTKEGRKRAESVVRKHRLAERLLTDII